MSIENKQNVYSRETLNSSSEDAKYAKKLILEAAEIFRPLSREHVGTVAIHLYSGTKLGEPGIDINLVTQTANVSIGTGAVTLMMPEIRDRIFEAFGAQRLTLAPKTVEETKDLKETVIKTSIDV